MSACSAQGPEAVNRAVEGDEVALRVFAPEQWAHLKNGTLPCSADFAPAPTVQFTCEPCACSLSCNWRLHPRQTALLNCSRQSALRTAYGILHRVAYQVAINSTASHYSAHVAVVCLGRRLVIQASCSGP